MSCSDGVKSVASIEDKSVVVELLLFLLADLASWIDRECGFSRAFDVDMS